MLLTDRHAINRAADFCTAAGDWHLPLFRAAADGQIALAVMRNPETKWPRAIERVTGSALVTVNADMGGDTDPLPAVWGCVKPLRKWAEYCIIHAAAGHPDHCRYALAMTIAFGRVAMIECTPRTAAAWVAAMECPPQRTWTIWPRGGVHSVRTEAVH